jgi:ligand-binding sensor domain-containing protein
VWASSFDGGMLYFDYLSQKSREFYINDWVEQSKYSSVLGCAKSADDTMWFVLSNGLIQVSGANKTRVDQSLWLDPVADDGLNLHQILFHDQQLFVATNRGIKTVYENRFFDLPMIESFNENIKHLMFDHQHRLWAITSNEVFVFSLKDKRWYKERLTLVDNLNRLLKKSRLSTIAQMNTSQIWVATQSEGVWIIDENNDHLFQLDKKSQPSITDNHIESMLQSKDGSIWLGTWLNGVNQLRFSLPGIRAIEQFENQHGEFIEPSVRAITRTSDGRYWIGTDQDGLFSGWSLAQPMMQYRQLNGADSGVPNTSIRVLLERTNGELWIGTENGLVQYEPLNTTTLPFVLLTSASEITGQRIRAIIEDSNHRLWVGSYDQGLSLWNDSNQKFINIPLIQQGELPKVTHLYLDRDRRLWVATDNLGVFILDTVQQKVLDHIQQHTNVRLGLPNNFIWSIFQHDKHTFWLGSYGKGVSQYQFNNKLFTHFTSEQGLPNNVIYSILQDNYGWLWSSTNKGLARYNVKGNQFSYYTRVHGLAHNEFNSGAYFKDISGRLIFGGLGGLVIVEPKMFLQSHHQVRVLLNQLTFNGRTANKVDSIHFEGLSFSPERVVATRDYNKIKMTFSSSDYFSAQEQIFAYRLLGVDSDWNISRGKRLVAIYNQLPAGRYQMEVKQNSRDFCER